MNARNASGAALVALGLGFNLPYAVLATSFDYPGVLRLPPAEILARFASGGPMLILTWYGFVLAALLMAGTAALLAVADRDRPAAAVIGTVGIIAGLLQAIGLSRWVFAVPAMAAAHADPATGDAARAAIEAAFLTLHSFAGVAIGEHLGQLLTAAWVAGVASSQPGVVRALGLASAGLVILGTGEGLALAMQAPADGFSLATIGGFLLLTVWLLISGANRLRPPRTPFAHAAPASRSAAG
jgi:hypothetical protein